MAFPRWLIYVMTIMRITAGINKAEDAGKMDAQSRSAEALWRVFPTTVARLSHVSWLGSPGGSREPAGLIVVSQLCYPVQHVLDAAAMASSATFRGILLRAVSGCCYNNGGLRNRRWANAITKHGGKGEWQTSVQSVPFSKSEMGDVTADWVEIDLLLASCCPKTRRFVTLHPMATLQQDSRIPAR